MLFSFRTNHLIFFTTMCLLAICVLIPEPAFAQMLPTDSMDIPGTNQGDSFIVKIKKLIGWTIYLLALAALGTGVAMSIFSLFKQVNDARAGNTEWGPAIQQMFIVLFVIVISIALYALLNTYVLTPLTQ